MDFINQNIWPIATAVIAVMALLIGMMVWRAVSPRMSRPARPAPRHQRVS